MLGVVDRLLFAVLTTNLKSPLVSSAISMISSANNSACASRARAYLSQNAGLSAAHRSTVDRCGMCSDLQITTWLSPSAIRLQINSARYSLY